MRILVISTHPDDETVGCGGRMLRHVAEGDDLYWLIATKIVAPGWEAGAIARQEEEVEQVAQAFGVREVFWPGFPTTRLDTTPMNDLVATIRETVEIVRPEWVYVVHHGDIHTDHHKVFQASTVVLKPFHLLRLGVKRVITYETISSTEAAPPFSGRAFEPNLFSDISSYVERKLEIMSMYRSQLQEYPLPRALDSIRALARYRGATVGVPYAEAFTIIRELN